jgi:kynurenine 3-monooxygenase
LSVQRQQLHAADRFLLLGGCRPCRIGVRDVEVFDALLDQYEDDWTKVLPAYTLARLEDAHAVSDLSDYSTPRSKWMNVEWLLRIIL